MSASKIIGYPLLGSRVHEVCGAAAYSFALQTAAQMGTQVLWIRESWVPGTLNPNGFGDFDPARLLLAQTPSQTDTLAVAEEALRDGAVPLVVLELTAPIGLIAGRRLQLAAKSGRSTGICLIPEGMGSNASETRWRASPVYDVQQQDSTLQNWEIIKNKSGTLGAWHVRWNSKARCISVVSPARKRPGFAGAPD